MNKELLKHRIQFSYLVIGDRTDFTVYSNISAEIGNISSDGPEQEKGMEQGC